MVQDEWVVVLEIAGNSGDPAIELSAFRDLLNAVSDCRPAALHSPDRYALQLCVSADDPQDALQRALGRWQAAAEELALPSWSIASVELLTAEEFTRQVHCEEGAAFAPTPIAVSEADGDGLEGGVLWRAFSDSLTNLASAGLFLARVERAVVRARSTQTSAAVLVLDLDDLAHVNEAVSREGGDEALVGTAVLLASTLRPGDTVARIGSDQFGVLLEPVASETAARAVAQRLVTAVRDGHLLADEGVELTGSAGIALSGPDHTAAQLVDEAGQALAAAKRLGPSQWMLYGTGASSETSQVDIQPIVLPDRAAYVGLLHQTANTANYIAGLEPAARAMLQQVCAHTGWAVGHLIVPAIPSYKDLGSSIWTQSADIRFGEFRQSRDSAPLEAVPVTQQALASRAPSWTAAATFPSSPGLSTSARLAGLTTMIAVPVQLGTEVVGALEFFTEHAVEPDCWLLDTLSTVGTHFARLLERSRAHVAAAKVDNRWKVLLQGQSETRTLVDGDGVVLSALSPQPAPPRPDSLAGQSFLDLVHPEDVELVRGVLAHAATVAGPVGPFDARLRSESGDWHWFESVADSFLDDPLVEAVVISSRNLRKGAGAAPGYKSGGRRKSGASLLSRASRLATSRPNDG